ncbi:MAG: flagellar basal body P-ring formation chaperone FlgA, partial [Pseudomonadota bacterium]
WNDNAMRKTADTPAQLILALLIACATSQAGAITEADVHRGIGSYYTLIGSPAPFDAGALVIAPLPVFVAQAQCDDLSVEPRLAGNSVSLALSCKAPQSWRAYVSARVATVRTVLTACHALPRATALSAADLCPAPATAGSTGQMLSSPSEAQHLMTKRAIGAGAIIYRHQLTPAVVVRRGDQVRIEARRGSALITASGKALRDGARGEQIEVVNSSSRRKLAVWVTGPGVTSTRAPDAPTTLAGPTAQEIFRATAKVPDEAVVNRARSPGSAGF